MTTAEEGEFRRHIQDHVDRLQESVEGLSARVETVESDVTFNTRITSELSGKVDAMHSENVARLEALHRDVAPILAVVHAGQATMRGATWLSRISERIGRTIMVLVGLVVFAWFLISGHGFAGAAHEFSRFIK